MSRLKMRLHRLEEAAERVGGQVRVIFAGPDGSGWVNGERLSAEELEDFCSTSPEQIMIVRFVRPKEWEDAYPESPDQPHKEAGK